MYSPIHGSCIRVAAKVFGKFEGENGRHVIDPLARLVTAQPPQRDVLRMLAAVAKILWQGQYWYHDSWRPKSKQPSQDANA